MNSGFAISERFNFASGQAIGNDGAFEAFAEIAGNFRISFQRNQQFAGIVCHFSGAALNQLSCLVILLLKPDRLALGNNPV